eukprot:TRINITY_DN712_c0_g5_i1.p1 TRINITY_DN712_c0_g5~~TRINITY_DN712_c0_g5_i1.p1  ORF type:complete len:1020 (+),score=289.14 TRINITY_DN712_c0_g5_i1:238-3297(+)
MLASCSDDKNVIVYELSQGQSLPNLGQKKNLENWKVKFLLKGHTGDVSDIAWCPDSSKLSSCSVDNSIIIWDVKKGAQLAVLKEHKGIVKGLSWDPIDRYLASQGDDESLILWNVDTWKPHKIIKTPYKKSSSSVFFKRSSWSADGAYLVTACGLKSKVHTAPVIRRNDWKDDKNLVGHSRPIVCAQFSPKLLKKDEIFTLVALGGQDNSLSLWATHKQRPFLLVRNLFQQSVLDMSWTSDGTKLLICSGDGTAAVCDIDLNERGTVISDEEFNRNLTELYGDYGSSRNVEDIIESPEQLLLEKEKKEKEKKEKEKEIEKQKERERELEKRVSAAATTTATTVAAAAVVEPTTSTTKTTSEQEISSSTTTAAATSSKTKKKKGKKSGGEESEIDIGVTDNEDDEDDEIEEGSEDAKSNAEESDREPVKQPTPMQVTPTKTTVTVVNPTCKAVEFQTPSGTIKQIITTLPGGKKRIMPQIITDSNSSSKPTEFSSLRSSGDSSTTTSTIASALTSSASAPVLQTLPTTLPISLTPTSIPATLTTVPLSKLTTHATTSVIPSITSLTSVVSEPTRIAVSLPEIPALAEPATKKSKKRKLSDDSKEQPKPKKKKVSDKKTGDINTEEDNNTTTTTTTESPAAPKKSSTLLSPPKVTYPIIKQMKSATVQEVFEINYSEATQVSTVRCISQNKPKWNDRIKSKVSCISFDPEGIIAIGCFTGELYVYGQSGRRLLPCIVVDTSPIVACIVKKFTLLVINCNGKVILWDINQRRQILTTNLEPISSSLSKGLISADINESDQVVIITGAGEAYLYDRLFASWLRISDNHYNMSEFKTNLFDTWTLSSDPKTVRPPLQQTQVTASSLIIQNQFVGFSSSTADIIVETISHLENQMAICLMIRSKNEYKRWFDTYVEKLTKESHYEKLTELCEQLLGANHNDPDDVRDDADEFIEEKPVKHGEPVPSRHVGWRPYILGFKKRDLLGEVLQTMTDNRKLQKVITRFKKELEMVNEFMSSTMSIGDDI